MRATFVRHGQSTGNLGHPADDFALIELTAQGEAQAQAVAEGWDAAPDLIVTSPFLRTRQTAAPTIARFPDVPVEVWPIQEFTCLEPSRWNGSTAEQRLPTLERYWATGDPDYRDGEGAESFAALIGRARDALARLAAMDGTHVVLFSHAQFIQAVLALVTAPGEADAARMARFWHRGMPAVVGNAGARTLEWDGAAWSLLPG